MRLAAQAKMGYYPVRPGTLDLLCGAIKIDDPSTVRILDPCCGQGKALAQIGELLHVPKENLYGVELDDRRAEEASQIVGNVMHSSFFAAKIVPVQSFSMAWVNPPYEDEIKQNTDQSARSLEVSFLQYVARYVIHDGLIVLHAPRDRITDPVTQTFHQMCYDPKLIVLPEELRPYRESLLIGYKKASIEKTQWNTHVPTVYDMPSLCLPHGEKIRCFQKSAPTDAEIIQGIEAAPFWKIFNEDKVRGKLTPVLPLGPGHLGLVLASGHLDGLLKPADCEPHVVRGIAYKEDELAKEESTEDDSGKVTTTQTFRQNIKLKIRAVTGDGTMHEIK